MTAPPYMKLYVAEWTADTQHLTCEQDGAYGRLVRAMWRAEGALPADPDMLARIVGLTPKEWAAIAVPVLALFSIKDGFLAHKRLQKEVRKYREIIRKNRANGKGGGVKSGVNRRTNKAKSAEANAKPKRSERSHNKNQNQTPIGEPIEGSPNRRREPALVLVDSPAPLPLEEQERRKEVAELLRGLAGELGGKLKVAK